jgi:hypothetical protein
VIRRALTRPWYLVITAVIALAMVTGAAAFWRGAGAGTASVTLADLRPVEITARTPVAQIYPGGVSNVAVRVSTPNPFAVHIGSLALDTDQGAGGFEVDPGHIGCDLSVLDVATADNGGPGWTIPPAVGSTEGSLSFPLEEALSMSSNAADACQGAIFTIRLVVGQ